MAENEPPVISHEYSSDPQLNEFFYQDRRMTFCGRTAMIFGLLATGVGVSGAIEATAGSPKIGWLLIGSAAILGLEAANEVRHYFNASSAIDDLYGETA